MWRSAFSPSTRYFLETFLTLLILKPRGKGSPGGSGSFWDMLTLCWNTSHLSLSGRQITLPAQPASHKNPMKSMIPFHWSPELTCFVMALTFSWSPVIYSAYCGKTFRRFLGSKTTQVLSLEWSKVRTMWWCFYSMFLAGCVEQRAVEQWRHTRRQNCSLLHSHTDETHALGSLAVLPCVAV